MKRILFLLMAVVLTACATKRDDHLVHRSVLSRSTASEKEYSSISAIERLKIVRDHIEALTNVISPLGNPRYYLLENFVARVNDQIDGLIKSQNEALKQEVFIPENKRVAKHFVTIVAAYKVMSVMGIILTYSDLMPDEKESTSQNFIQLDRALGRYQDALKELMFSKPNIAAVEDYEEAQKREYIHLLKYLVNRLDTHYEKVVSDRATTRRVRRIVRRINRLERKVTAKQEKKIARIHKSKTWNRLKLKLRNVSLPESSDIEGSDAAFETVMSVQLGSELIDQVMLRYLERE